MKSTIVASIILALFFNSINSTQASNSVLSTGTWYKLSASETGIYVITYNDLLAYGIPASTIDPRNISLFGNSPGEVPLLNGAPRPNDLQEIAIEVKGEGDGVFDVGDTIFFYNHSQMTWTPKNSSPQFQHQINHYSDSTYFYLTVGGGIGKRISDQQSLPNFTVATSNYTEYSIHESEQINFLHSGKEWYGEHFDLTSNPTQSFPINISNIANDTVFVNVNFAGRDTVSPGSSITWTLNGYTSLYSLPMVGTTVQDNFASIVNNNRYVIGPLINDSIVLTLQSPNSTAEGWLNFIEVNAIRNLIFDRSPISFRDLRKVGTGQVVKYNLTANAGIKIWDVTSFNDIKNQLYTLNSPMLNFNSAADSLREFIAFDGSNFLQPNFIGTVANQNLHSVSQQNMIIVTDNDFLSEATTLAQYHQTVDSLSTTVVSSEQIFNEYGSGVRDPGAIRDFIRQVYFSATSSSDSLKYVLIFGAPSYDYKNILGYGQSVVPTHESDGSINLTQTYSTDDFYSLMDSSEGMFYNNEIADLAIGRIPVRTSQEAQVINKIIGYSASSSFGMWRTLITSVADDQDYNIHFRQTDTLAERIESYDCGLNSNKIYADAFVEIYDSITNQERYPDANIEIQKAFQQGCAVIQYMGHADSTAWASERILEYEFLDTVNNISNLPLILAGTASFNAVDDPEQYSGGQRALMNQSGGCIASIAASRISYSSSNYNFMQIMIQKLFERNSGRWPTLGEAFINTKKRMYVDPYVRSNSLLGDPAVRILLPENDVVVTTFSPDTISPGQPVQMTGEIHDRFGSVITSFNGPVDITFFNPKTIRMTLGNNVSNPSNPSTPQPFMFWDDTLYNATVNVVNGAFSLNFIMPINIDSGFGAGRIAFYANDGVVDAMGCYQNFVLENLTSGIDEYSNVQIQLFPNPATDQIKCMLNNVVAKNWSYTLTGIDGRKLRSEKIVGQEFFIERNSLASGIYFLKIVDAKNKVVKVEKIVFE